MKKLYPLIATYEEAIVHTTAGTVPRNTVDFHAGTTQFRFKFISDQREEIEIHGIRMKRYVKVIETIADISFREKDRVYIGSERYTVAHVDKHITATEEKAVRLWPNSLQHHQAKRITLASSS